MSSVEKINELIDFIDEIQECIEYSNFELMNRYIQVFFVNYSKALMDIIQQQRIIGDEAKVEYWTEVTPKLIGVVRENDIFGIIDVLFFDMRARLGDLVKT